MFVNISPADYNCDETSTSLQYASRVKNITNNATKQVSSCPHKSLVDVATHCCMTLVLFGNGFVDILSAFVRGIDLKTR